MAKDNKNRKRTGRKKKSKGQTKMTEHASLAQTVSFRPTSNPSTNTLYGMYNFSLSNCDRAVQVGQAYQFYRIKRIVMTFKPLQDTFADGSGSVPHLYYRIDRSGQYFYNNVNFNSLRDSGAKPIRFDDKNIIVKFKPAVLSQGFNFDPAQAPWAPSKISPWLPTNGNLLSLTNPWKANSTEHMGITFGVEKDYLATPSTQAKYDVDMTIYYEFKKPLYQSATGPTIPSIKLDVNDLAAPEGPPLVPIQDA